VILRPATADDVPAVARLEADLFGVDAWSADGVREELTGDRRTALVADQDGRVVGYVVTMDSGDVVDLQRVAVHPAHRRRGLARELLASAGTGSRMLLEVASGNEPALAFYAAEGFTEIHRRRRYYRDGVDAVVMERPGTPQGRMGP
jgi:[ribosomal protein S18]-alanine N-acetyltransferase